MSKRPVDFLRPGPLESRGNSSDESTNDDSDINVGWPSARKNNSASASGTSSAGRTTGFSGITFTEEHEGGGSGHLARAVLNEAGRRYDKKTKDLIEKTMEV